MALRTISVFLQHLLALGESLSERVITSGICFALTNVIDRALQFVIVLFVTRIIGPDDYGAMAFALVVRRALT